MSDEQSNTNEKEPLGPTGPAFPDDSIVELDLSNLNNQYTFTNYNFNNMAVGANGPNPYIVAGSNTPYITYNNSTYGIECNKDVKIDGNLIVQGKNLNILLNSIEDRLAIISDVNPKKLEKYAALKEAYEQYRLIEKLINDPE